MAQMIEYLPEKFKALSSNPRTAKKKKRKRKRNRKEKAANIC
jgi:hypothetical protein